MQSCVAIFVWHIYIDFKRAICLAIIHEVCLDNLARQFKLGLCQGNVHWKAIFNTVDACFCLRQSKQVFDEPKAFLLH